jgi:hypothetical protein
VIYQSHPHPNSRVRGTALSTCSTVERRDSRAPLIRSPRELPFTGCSLLSEGVGEVAGHQAGQHALLTEMVHVPICIVPRVPLGVSEILTVVRRT